MPSNKNKKNTTYIGSVHVIRYENSFDKLLSVVARFYVVLSLQYQIAQPLYIFYNIVIPKTYDYWGTLSEIVKQVNWILPASANTDAIALQPKVNLSHFVMEVGK